MATIYINGQEIKARKGETILAVCEREGIEIPTLCYMKELSPTGACRICVVEVEGYKNLLPACAFPVEDGMKIETNSPRVRRARKTNIELLIANHPQDCLVCVRNGNCELQDLTASYGIREYRYMGERRHVPCDIASPSLERDPEKCILCGRCVNACNEIQKVGAIDFIRRGFSSLVAPAYEYSVNETSCIYCGQCIMVCPVGALREKSHQKLVWEYINDRDLFTVAQIAPAVRVAVGEEFGLEPGVDVSAKMVTALKRMGFDRVFDTNFGADLTIMEEASELVHRLQKDQPIPMITSCSPGWVKYLEHFYPELLPHLSTCKSPHEMEGAIIKSYYAKIMGIEPEKIRVVSVMPCVAKKFEAQRPELGGEFPDVDAVITTREFIRMLKIAGIDFTKLPETEFDNPLGESTGAGAIFGASGGVMEAALRTAYWMITGVDLENLDFIEVRGLKGVKEAEVDINGTKLRVAAVSGVGHVREILDDIKNGKSRYHFIEVMACEGGCINGGGQPIPRNTDKLIARQQGLYRIDKNRKSRCSHHNEGVKILYKEFLEKPNSSVSHQYLHTKYTTREMV
jgi:NADH-quinone oxidoreductase subunit G/NADP-reducing hydrogenase subunit HndD